MKRCAICIPTYNRPEVIDELLIRCLNVYLEYQYDLYIFDSSENNETERIINSFRQNFANLNYYRMDSKMHSGEKVYSIFEWAGLACEYEYLWLIGDSFCWNKNVMQSVRNWLECGFDLLVVDDLDPDRLGVKFYDDQNTIFQECAWRMTLFGSTVLNVRRMLSDVNWEQIKARYFASDTINHFHVLFYFVRIMELQRFKGIHVGVPMASKIGTTQKKENSWWNNVFHIWMDCWKKSINSLPEYYKSKKQVIKSHGIKSGLFSFNGFIKLRRLGVLTLENYLKYKNEWKEFTDVSPCLIRLISIMPIKCLWLMEIKNKWPQILFDYRLKKYVRKNINIILYGCGNRAKVVVDIMRKYGEKPKLYIVSDSSNEKNNVNGVPVAKYDPLYLEDEKTLLVVALNKQNATEVRKNLMEGNKPKCKILFADF